MTAEEARLRELLEWVQKKSREAMWTMPGTKEGRAVRDKCLAEINAGTMEFWK